MLNKKIYPCSLNECNEMINFQPFVLIVQYIEVDILDRRRLRPVTTKSFQYHSEECLKRAVERVQELGELEIVGTLEKRSGNVFVVTVKERLRIVLLEGRK